MSRAEHTSEFLRVKRVAGAGQRGLSEGDRAAYHEEVVDPHEGEATRFSRITGYLATISPSDGRPPPGW